MPSTPHAALRPLAGRRTAVATTLALACTMGAAVPSMASAAGPSARVGVASVPAGLTTGLRSDDHDRLGDSGVVTDLPADVPTPPELDAASYVLADLGSGDVLVGKAAHDAHLSASTMKLLTGQTLMPRMAADLKITAEDSDARVDGTRVGLVPGRTYTADQLFHAMLMGSANDAAEALARGNGGLDRTLTEMNERAAQLGAKDTVAKTPHGLDAPGQQSTAYDLVTILRGALDTPAVAKILTETTYDFPKYPPLDTPSTQPSSGAAGPASATAGADTRPQSGATSAAGATPSASVSGAGAAPAADTTQRVASMNKLLWNYEGTIGGKDGYTDAAGHTYVGAVRRGDKTYAVAFMGGKINYWKPMTTLFDWAFANGAKAKAVGKLPGAVAPVAAPAPAAAVGATDSGGGLLAAIGGFFLTLAKILLWTLLILAVAVVALRVRKLRRDARRRMARRRAMDARQAASAASAWSVATPAAPVVAAVPAYDDGGYDNTAYDNTAYDESEEYAADRFAYDQAVGDTWTVQPLGDAARRGAPRAVGPQARTMVAARPQARPRVKERTGRQ